MDCGSAERIAVEVGIVNTLEDDVDIVRLVVSVDVVVADVDEVLGTPMTVTVEGVPIMPLGSCL